MVRTFVNVHIEDHDELGDIARELYEVIKEYEGEEQEVNGNFKLLVKAIFDLGWNFLVPEDETIDGLIIGDESYLDKIGSALDASQLTFKKQ